MSKQKYTLRKSKKYKNLVSAGLGLATVVAIGVATDNEAFANEIVDNSKVEVIKENLEKVNSKLVTKEQVDTAKENLDKIQSEVKEQEAVVKAEEIKVNTTIEELAKANKEKSELEKISKEATPEKIEETKKEVETKKDVVKTEENKLEVLKGQEQVKNQDVFEAKKELILVQNELDKAKEQTRQAENSLQNAKDILVGTNADKIIKTLEEAKKQVKLSEIDKVTREKALEEAKKLDKERQDKISNLTLEKQQKTQVLEEIKSDLELKVKEANESEQVLLEAKNVLEKATNDVDGINNIVLSNDYVQALKTYMDYSLQETVREQAKLVLKSENDKLLQLNKFKQNKNDSNVKLDVNNLSDELRLELSLFASDLINQIRSQFNNKNTIVSSSAVDFAKKVADEYVINNFGIYQGHYEAGIEKVSREYGLSEGQFYENLRGLSSQNKELTKSQLKELIYYSIVEFMFNGREWLHAQSIAGINFNNPQKDYLGIDFSVSKGTGIHFITVGEDEVLKATKSNFDTKEIINNNTSDKLKQILQNAKNNFNEKDTDNNKKQIAKKYVENVLSDTQNSLYKVTNDLNKILETKELTSQAEISLQDSQNKLKQDNKLLDIAQENYNNLSADIKVKQEAVLKAENNLKVIKQEEVVKQENYNNVLTKYNNLKLELQLKQKEILEQQQVIKVAEDKVKETKVYLEKLLNAPALLEEVRKQQEFLEKKLSSFQGVLKSEQEKLSKLKLQEQDLLEKYNKLFIEYSNQEKNKEIEQLFNDLHVQDKGRNNLVDNSILESKLLPKTGLEQSSSLLGIILMILTLGLYRKKIK